MAKYKMQYEKWGEKEPKAVTNGKEWRRFDCGNRRAAFVVIFCFLSMVLFLCGCTYDLPAGFQNHRIENSKIAQLQEGRTTREEVISLLGKTSFSCPSDSGEILTYRWFQTKLGASAYEDQIVSLYFDSGGVLQKLTHSQGYRLVNPKPIESGILSKLKEGQTNKHRIVELIGRPLNVQPGFEGKGEVWTYWRAGKMKEPITNYFIGPLIYQQWEHRQQQITMYIDDNGVLQKISKTDKNIKTKSGIFAN